MKSYCDFSVRGGGDALCFCVFSFFLSGIYDVQDSSFNLAVWFWTVAKDETVFLCESTSSFPLYFCKLLAGRWYVLILESSEGVVSSEYVCRVLQRSVSRFGSKRCSKSMAGRLADFNRWKSRRRPARGGVIYTDSSSWPRRHLLASCLPTQITVFDCPGEATG